MNENVKAFIIYIISFILKIIIHPDYKAQIALLLAKKVIIPVKYSDFADIFSKKLAEVLSKQTRVNKYAIKFKKGKKPLYRPIYSLKLIELKTFKTYIKINLANSFIKALKLVVDGAIIFVGKPNNGFYL